MSAHLARIARQPKPGDIAGRGQKQAVVHFVRGSWVYYGVFMPAQYYVWRLRRMTRARWRRQVETRALYAGRVA